MHDFIKISARQSNTKEKLLKKQTAPRVKRKSDKIWLTSNKNYQR